LTVRRAHHEAEPVGVADVARRPEQTVEDPSIVGQVPRSSRLTGAPPADPAAIASLQRLAGNAAVSALLQPGGRKGKPGRPVQRRASATAPASTPASTSTATSAALNTDMTIPVRPSHDTKARSTTTADTPPAGHDGESTIAVKQSPGGPETPVKPGIVITGTPPAETDTPPPAPPKPKIGDDVPVRPAPGSTPPPPTKVLGELPAKPPILKEAKAAKAPKPPKGPKAPKAPKGGAAKKPGPAGKAAAGGPAGGPGAKAAAKPGAPAAPAPVVPLLTPTPASEGAGLIIDEVKASAEKGQTDFLGTVDEGLTQIDTAAKAEIDRIDVTAKSQKARIDGAFKAAKARVAAAVAAAGQQLDATAKASQARLTTAHTDAKTAAQDTFTAKKKEVQDLGKARGEEAETASETAATKVETDVESTAKQVHDKGEAKAASASSDIPEGVDAMRQAARGVASNTEEEVRKSLGDTAGQLRQAGADAKPSFTQKTDEVAAQVMAALPGILEQIGTTHGETTKSVGQAASTGRQSLSDLGKAVIANLEAMHQGLSRTLAQGVAQNKAKVAGASEDAKAAVLSQRDAALQASNFVVNQVLGGVANRKIRREAAQRLSRQLGSDVRAAFAGSQGTAQRGTAQIATTFAVAAEQTLTALQTIGSQAETQASTISSGAAADAKSQGAGLAESVTKTTDAGINANTTMVTASKTSLDTHIASVDTDLKGSLTELKGKMEGKVGEAVDRAHQPTKDVDSRIDEAKRKADERAHQSWLERQWSDITESLSWGMLAGLIVGLLVTIAIIALFGSGFWVLVIAGAVAGALSTMASTLVQNAVDGRPTDWADLGKQMAIGAVFGAIGGAVGGGMAAGIQTRVASGLMQRGTAALLGQGGDVVSGAVLGAVQNVATGEPWDKGLLMNLGMGVAMSAAGPGVEKATNKARAGAIDAGVAVETKYTPVTPEERTAANVRAVDKGLDPPYPTPTGPRAPKAGVDAAATPAAKPAADADVAPAAGVPAKPPPAEIIPAPPPAAAKAAADTTPPKPVAGTPATPKQIEAHYGITPENQKKIQAVAQEYGVEVDVRPTNLDSAKLLAEGKAVYKPEDVKSKTISQEDVHLGCRPEDKGKAGYFSPKEDWPTVEARLKAEGLSPEQIKKVEARHKERTAEFKALKETMDELQKPTNKQESDRENLGISGQTQIAIDENGVVMQVDPKTGAKKPFAGDHDVWDIRRPGGPPLTRSEYLAIIDKLKAANAGVLHGAHLEWPTDAADYRSPKVKKDVFKPIYEKHTKSNEPVVRFGPGGTSVANVGATPPGSPTARGGVIGGIESEHAMDSARDAEEKRKEEELAGLP
jgi:hypothetical protein